MSSTSLPWGTYRSQVCGERVTRSAARAGLAKAASRIRPLNRRGTASYIFRASQVVFVAPDRHPGGHHRDSLPTDASGCVIARIIGPPATSGAQDGLIVTPGADGITVKS